MADKGPVLVILGPGGHASEMAVLLSGVGRADYVYLAARGDDLARERLPFPGPVHAVANPAPPFSPLPERAARAVLAAFASAALVARLRPRAAVANGPGIALFPLVVARILGARVVFVESIARTQRLSLTGRLIGPFAHALFVQWEPLAKRTRGARFAGRLM